MADEVCGHCKRSHCSYFEASKAGLRRKAETVVDECVAAAKGLEILELRDQVQKLTAERDKWKRRAKQCGCDDLENPE